MSNIDAFRLSFPAEFGWMVDNAPRNDFAFSLLNQVKAKGSLSPRQMECVQRNVAKVVSAASASKSAPEVCQDKLMQAFDTARANKLTRLKIRYDGFFVYPASEASANAGGIYVKSTEGEYLGKITNGRFSKAYSCDAITAGKVVAVMTDPLREAIAYGKQTGNCAICGRFLENADSVERGIGPICAAKYGFI